MSIIEATRPDRTIPHPTPFVTEDVHVAVHVVVAPVAGAFAPAHDAPDVGEPLWAGRTIGTVGTTETCTPFTGIVAGWMAEPGERVRAFQPLLWLREAS